MTGRTAEVTRMLPKWYRHASTAVSRWLLSLILRQILVQITAGFTGGVLSFAAKDFEHVLVMQDESAKKTQLFQKTNYV